MFLIMLPNLHNMVERLAPQIRLALTLSLFALLVSAQAADGRSDLSAEKSQTPHQAATRLQLLPFAGGLNSPVGVVGSDDGRLFVIERRGIVRTVLPDGSVVSEPFLDISKRVDASSSEEGLLGLALHPQFAENGFFFLNYTNSTNGVGRTRISRFSVGNPPTSADADSEEILMTIDQPYENHNGGHILFGPDGFLYIPLGDGGGGGDPDNRAQDLNTLLGKIARIDVNSISSVAADCSGQGSGDYTVPEGNPFVDGAGGACDEILDLGLRNPWRASFDRELGDLYLGDVGQNSWEEVNLHPAGVSPGQNFGWRCYEGNHPYNTIGCGPAESYRAPIFEYYQAGNGCSVIAGYVYRGWRHPDIYGHFFLTDYCSGNFWELIPDQFGGWNSVKHTNLRRFGYVAFGEACDGELYLANIDNGVIYRLSAESESVTPNNAVRQLASLKDSVQMESWSFLPVILTNYCQ